jgi:hypothetical protein
MTRFPQTHTYAKLKDYTIGVVWSDNQDTETMHLVLEKDWDNKRGDYDIESVTTYEFNYYDIAMTERDLSLVRGYRVKEPGMVTCLNDSNYEVA